MGKLTVVHCSKCRKMTANGKGICSGCLGIRVGPKARYKLTCKGDLSSATYYIKNIRPVPPSYAAAREQRIQNHIARVEKEEEEYEKRNAQYHTVVR